MYGLLGMVILTYALWKRYELALMEYVDLVVKVFSDNKEAISKAYEKGTKLNVSEFMKPEYDVESLIWDIQGCMPIKIDHQWVKGHQNETKEGVKIFGSF